MKNIHIILLVLVGFLLIPATTYACGSANHSCKKEISKTQKDNCCAGHKDSNGKHNGCDGKCGHKQCGCSSSIGTAAAFLGSMSDTAKEPTKIIIGKDNFYYSKPHLSSGFFSLWLIPKIS